MPSLKFGLNLSKKASHPPARASLAQRKAAFDDEDSEPEEALRDERPQFIDTVDGLKSPPTAPTLDSNRNEQNGRTQSRKPPPISQFGDLSANHAAAKHAAQAQEVDSSVYDYDAVYDSLHAKPARAKTSTREGPKYMTSLLAAAEVRKRDQLRAQEKMIQLEREQEGEEFADKEEFVTGAYKAQQAELRRLEEEEAKKEEMEMERRKHGGGMTGFYKDVLSREDAKHELAMKAVEEAKIKKGQVEDMSEEQQAAKSEAEVAKESGAMVNEDGQIIDKRQLLKGGLNVVPKPEPQNESLRSQAALKNGMPTSRGGRRDTKQVVRERQSNVLEAQHVETAKRAADDEDSVEEAMMRSHKRKITEKDLSLARA